MKSLSKKSERVIKEMVEEWYPEGTSLPPVQDFMFGGHLVFKTA